jgi:hypothetical protein
MNFESIKALALHDAPVAKIDIDTANKKCAISVEIYNDNIDDYDLIILQFDSVQNLNIEGALGNLSDTEISGTDISIVDNGFYCIIFTMLCKYVDNVIIPFIIKFEFKSYSIVQVSPINP